MKTKLISALFFSLLLHPFAFHSTAFAVIPAPNAGRITSFSPTQASRGTVVKLHGQNFDRDIYGKRWSGAPPYRVNFRNPGPLGLPSFLATPTFVSSTTLKVTIPATSPTRKFRIVFAQAVPGGVGSWFGWAPHPPYLIITE
jgi:IPT/TIG domain